MSARIARAITLRQLRAFVAVAREGSFTRGAEVVRLTQPSLTSCIRQLEDQLGATLFDRTTRQVELNRFGASFLPRAEQILRDLEQAVEEVQCLREGTAGRIALATVPSIASSILPLVLARFARLSPSVGLTLTEDHSEGVRRKVSEGEADFGLGGAVTDVFPDVEAQPLFFDTVGLFCQRDHPLARIEGPLRWADLSGREIFNMGYQTQIQEILDVVPELAISFSQTAYRVRNTLTTLTMIRSGDVIAALPRLSIPTEALTDVVFTELNEPVLRRDIFLCKRVRTHLPEAARPLIAEIRASAAAAGAMLYDWSDDTP